MPSLAFSLFLSLLVLSVTAVRKCANGSLPAAASLGLCSEFSESSCCTKDDTLLSNFNIATKSSSTSCKNLLRQVYCASCDPFSSHLFLAHHPTAVPQRTKPVLCKSFCSKLYQACETTTVNDEFGLGLGQGLSEDAFCAQLTYSDSILCVGYQNEGRQLPSTSQIAFPSLTFTSPVDLRFRNGIAYLVQRGGIIRRFSVSNPTVTTTFLDITSRVSAVGEGGLLAMVLDPQFETSGKFYVFYSTVAGTVRMIKISRFDATASVVANSEQTILSIPHPNTIHWGGWMDFGQDGYLYISLGDGGSGAAARDLSSLLGKILRIDVSSTTYTIPSTNPYVGTPNALPEIYASGLRNPFRCSIDGPTGELWCGDVGQASFEELDHIEKGDDLGWHMYEAFRCYTAPCDEDGLKFPAIYLDRSKTFVSGKAIIGGRFYHGSQYPLLQDSFIFADYMESKLMRGTRDGSIVEVLMDTTEASTITAFAEDPNTNILYWISGNQIRTFSNPIASADLSATISSPPTLQPGRTFTVPIRINNAGPQISSARLRFTIPPSTFHTPSADTYCVGSSQQVASVTRFLPSAVCSRKLPTISAAGFVQTQIVFGTPLSVPCSTSSITFSGTVHSSLFDLSPSNNDVSATIPVNADTVLSVNVAVNDTYILENDNIQLSISITNTGFRETDGQRVFVDYPPASFSITDSNWVCAAGTCQNSTANILSNATTTVQLNAKITDTKTIPITVRAQSCSKSASKQMNLDVGCSICQPSTACQVNLNLPQQTLCVLVGQVFAKRDFTKAIALSRLKSGGSGLPGQFINGLCCTCDCVCTSVASVVLPA